MTAVEFLIACPRCNYSNIATASNPKYKEVVYQSCNEKDGKHDHNVKDRIRCDSCHNDFDFYWCVGHSK